MSALNDPRVTAVDGGYQVLNDEAVTLMVLRDGPWPDADWRAYFGQSTSDDRHPWCGIAGSASRNVEETVAWALRTEAEVRS